MPVSITPASTWVQVIHRSSVFSSAVDNTVDNTTESLTYFHWVDTPKPPAMKPNPTTMFQLPRDSIGSRVSVT